jgi:hypothetical protein
LAGVLGERAVLLQTVLQKRPARTPVAFGPEGHLYVALLSSSRQESQGQSIRGDRFLVRLNDDGSAAPGNPMGSMFDGTSSQNPLAVAWAPDSVSPWVFQGSVESGYSLTRSGDSTVITHGLSPSLPGVAMLIDTIGGEEVLYITGQGGSVQRLDRHGDTWVVGRAWRLFDGAKSIRDLLRGSNGDVLACGTTDGSHYGVWRARLP